MNKKKIIGLISVLVILLVGGVGFTLYNKPVKAPENIVTLDLTLNENTYYIDTKDYELTMQEVVEPYLDAIVKSDYLISKDGAKIHYRQYLNPEAKGEIVISHGLTEAAEKYKEVIYYFIQEGYSVHIAEQIGRKNIKRGF